MMRVTARGVEGEGVPKCGSDVERGISCDVDADRVWFAVKEW